MNQITDLKSGNEKRFLEAYQMFHLKLFNYFLKRTNGRETSSELTQQVFIKLWQFRHTLSIEHTLDVQLFNMANSVLVDHLRREAVQKRNNVAWKDEYNEACDPVVPDSGYESDNYLTVISNNLPPVRKNIFLLKISSGYSNREIAEQLSISVKTVEDHYSKALRHVRSLVTLFYLVFITIHLALC